MPLELVIHTILLPLAASFAFAGILGRIGARGRQYAVLGVGFGFLAGYYMILGFPLLPPRSAPHKIFYIVCMAVLAGAVLGKVSPPGWLGRVCGTVIPALAAAWLAFAGLMRLDADVLIKFAFFSIICGCILFDTFSAKQQEVSSGTQFLVAGGGMAALAVTAAAGSLGQLTAAYAAALGGYLLWNWPQVRYPFGGAGIFVAGSVCFSLAAVMVFFSDIPPISMALLATVFLSGRIGRLLWRNTWASKPVLVPVITGFIALVPALLAIAAAAFTADSGYGY